MKTQTPFGDAVAAIQAALGCGDKDIAERLDMDPAQFSRLKTGEQKGKRVHPRTLSFLEKTFYYELTKTRKIDYDPRKNIGELFEKNVRNEAHIKVLLEEVAYLRARLALLEDQPKPTKKQTREELDYLANRGKVEAGPLLAELR